MISFKIPPPPTTQEKTGKVVIEQETQRQIISRCKHQHNGARQVEPMARLYISIWNLREQSSVERRVAGRQSRAQPYAPTGGVSLSLKSGWVMRNKILWRAFRRLPSGVSRCQGHRAATLVPLMNRFPSMMGWGDELVTYIVWTTY
jgi:hypothetical protein